MEHTPQYYELLSDEDKHEYMKLKDKLALPEFSNQRGRSRNTFVRALELTHQYVNRDNTDTLKRSLVCGITWLSTGLAVNIQQLRILMSKCKSSINNSFGLQGYETIPSGVDSAKELIVMFPFLKNNFNELRKWTIRRRGTNEIPTTPETPVTCYPVVEAKITQLSFDSLEVPTGSSFDMFQEHITPPEADVPMLQYGIGLGAFDSQDIMFDL